MLRIRATVPTVLAIWALLLLGSAALARSVTAASLPDERTTTNARAEVGHRGVCRDSRLYLRTLPGTGRVLAGYFHIDVFISNSKAKTIYSSVGLTQARSFTSQIQPELPPLKPGLDAVAFAFAGKPDPLLIPVQSAFVDVAFLAAVAAVSHARNRACGGTPSAHSCSLLPRMTYFVGSSLADELLAALFALTVLLIACWLLTCEPRFLALAALFMTAATLTKNDGAMLSLVAVSAGIAAGRASSGASSPWRPYRSDCLSRWKP